MVVAIVLAAGTTAAVDDASGGAAAGSRGWCAVLGSIERGQIVEMTQARLNVLHVNLHVIPQRGHVGFVQGLAEVVQRVVQGLQFVGVALALGKALQVKQKQENYEIIPHSGTLEQELTLICSINEVRPVISERIGADVT